MIEGFYYVIKRILKVLLSCFGALYIIHTILPMKQGYFTNHYGNKGLNIRKVLLYALKHFHHYLLGHNFRFLLITPYYNGKRLH